MTPMQRREFKTLLVETARDAILPRLLREGLFGVMIDHSVPYMVRITHPSGAIFELVIKESDINDSDCSPTDSA